MIEREKGIIDIDHVLHQWRDLGTNPDLAQKGLYLFTHHMFFLADDMSLSYNSFLALELL